jgi:RNA polymerase sigma-70 factor (sigma-E family)
MRRLGRQPDVRGLADGRPDPGSHGYELRAVQRWAVTKERPMATEERAVGFDDFYSATARRVVRHAYALTGNIADAQDVAQEAYARAWQRWESVGGCDSPEAWVRRVATNLALSRFRRDRTARAAAHQLIARAVAPEISPDTVALVAALRTLPERQRVVLVLHYLADLPVGQIATELRCPVGSVKAWLSRGREALAAAMNDEGTGAGSKSGQAQLPRREVTDA